MNVIFAANRNITASAENEFAQKAQAFLLGYGVKRLNVPNKERDEWEKIEPFDNLYTQDDTKLLNIERWLIDDFWIKKKLPIGRKRFSAF